MTWTEGWPKKFVLLDADDELGEDSDTVRECVPLSDAEKLREALERIARLTGLNIQKGRLNIQKGPPIARAALSDEGEQTPICGYNPLSSQYRCDRERGHRGSHRFSALTDEGEREPVVIERPLRIEGLTRKQEQEVADYISEKYGITDEGERDG